jgi:hypothetical protein
VLWFVRKVHRIFGVDEVELTPRVGDPKDQTDKLGPNAERRGRGRIPHHQEALQHEMPVYRVCRDISSGSGGVAVPGVAPSGG